MIQLSALIFLSCCCSMVFCGSLPSYEQFKALNPRGIICFFKNRLIKYLLVNKTLLETKPGKCYF